MYQQHYVHSAIIKLIREIPLFTWISQVVQAQGDITKGMYCTVDRANKLSHPWAGRYAHLANMYLLLLTWMSQSSHHHPDHCHSPYLIGSPELDQ